MSKNWTQSVDSAVRGIPAGKAVASVPREDASRIGLMVVLIGIYFAMHVTPFAELSVIYLHIPIPVVALMCALVSVMALFTLRLSAFLHSPLALPWFGLLLMLILASVFGLYPRMSTTFILGYGSRFHLMPLLVCAIVVTTRQVRHVMYWMIGGHVLALLVCWGYGGSSDGRFGVSDVDAYANPNDLASLVIYGMCLSLLLLSLRSFVAKLVCLAIFTISVMYVLRTGSRAGFVCVGVILLVMFLFAPGRIRIGLLAIAPMLAAVLILAVPRSTWTRLSLIAVDTEAEYATTTNEDARRAIESQVARVNLQKRAVELTLRHPLLGVGPLMFADAADALAMTNTGKKSGWQGTHNVYLEIASEAGIPALIFHVWSILLCLKLNYQSFKRCRGIPALRMNQTQSFCLLLTTGAFGISIFFCNFTFGAHLPMLVGLAAANAMAVKQEVKPGLV